MNRATNEPLLECVPNFSEGENIETIEKIAQVIRTVPDVYLLDIDRSAAAQRTVFSFAGKPEAVIEAAYKAIQCASNYIDMQQQKGVHPRIGAADVCPLVPLKNMSIEVANQYAHQLAKRVGECLEIPTYLYEHSQQQLHRKWLPQIRKGQYEGLAQKLQQEEWQPDYGPHKMNVKSGACIIGVRDILVAFNISLNTQDETKVQSIAKQLRTQSQSATALPKLRAIGWYMADYANAQVSFNLLDYKQTSVLNVFLACKQLAEEMGLEIVGSELIGLMPLACLEEVQQYCEKISLVHQNNERNYQAAIDFLKIEQLKPFSVQDKILEFALAKHQL